MSRTTIEETAATRTKEGRKDVGLGKGGSGESGKGASKKRLLTAVSNLEGGSPGTKGAKADKGKAHRCAE